MLSAAGEAFLFFGTEQRGCILGLDRRGRAWLPTRVPSPQDRSGLERCRQRTLDCAKRPISGSSLCPLGLSPVESSGLPVRYQVVPEGTSKIRPGQKQK